MSELQRNADAPEVPATNWEDKIICSKCRKTLTEIIQKGLPCVSGSHFAGQLGAVRGC